MMYVKKAAAGNRNKNKNISNTGTPQMTRKYTKKGAQARAAVKRRNIRNQAVV
jgi:hypothetical protein